MSVEIFGLDFGTTNSALSLNRGGRVEVIDIDEFNLTGEILKSVLYFDEEGNIDVGQKAIDCYIDNDARGRFMQSIKSFLPSGTFEYTIIKNKKYALEDLIAIILKKMKIMGESFVGHEVSDVVMGRPVIFSNDQGEDLLAEWRLRKAAEIAGFKNISFQLEPIAAAFAFEESLQRGEEKIVFIGDFGGGTSDFTIIKLRGGAKEIGINRKKDVLSLNAVSVAGDVFDSQLMWHKTAKYFGKDSKFKSMTGQWLEIPSTITFKLRRWHLIPQLRDVRTREYIRQIKHTSDNRDGIENLEHLIEDNYGFMLFQKIEKSKIDLSYNENSTINFKERNLVINEEITRKEFEEIISNEVRKIKDSVNETIAKACLSPSGIDAVFLTGGSSHIPCIRKLFIEKFGKENICQKEAFTSVAYGLGLSASMIIS